jgi:hypothetical protein
MDRLEYERPSGSSSADLEGYAHFYPFWAETVKVRLGGQDPCFSFFA